MDLDDLIRTELTDQASYAPDPHAVLAGVPARARARRHRLVAAAAVAAVAVALAVTVPYGLLRHGAPATTAASSGRQSVGLTWQPGWAPAELTETNREVRPGTVSGRYTDYARNLTQGIDWQVGNQGLGLPPAGKRVPVRVGPWDGFWDVSTPEDGMARLYFHVEPGLWAFVGVTRDWTADPRGVALRFGAALHQGDAQVDVPVRFDWLPAGLTVAPGINAGSTGSADAWAVAWTVTGRTGGVGVSVSRGTLAQYAYPGAPEVGTEGSRRTVRVGDRTGTVITSVTRGSEVVPLGQPPSVVGRTRLVLEVPLADGETLTLMPSPDLSEAEAIRIAAGAVQLPVDYGWMGR
jgi:hypothetical protein